MAVFERFLDNMDVVLTESGHPVVLNQAQAQVIFMAVAVSRFDGSVKVGEGLRLEEIAKEVGEILGDLFSPEAVSSILKYYETKYLVKDFADFGHHWKLTHDLAYRFKFTRDRDNINLLAAQRKREYKSQKQTISTEFRLSFASDVVKMLLANVTYETLVSTELCELVNVSTFGVSYDEYRQVLRTCIIDNPLGVGANLPNRNGSTRVEEVEQANRLLHSVMYGPSSFLPLQKRFYVVDVARLAKFASFQTLASMECYVYLGERFRFIGERGERRNKTRELMQHVNVVGVVMDRMDHIDMNRIRTLSNDDYENAIIRKQEMIEIKYRFGNTFQRKSDESQMNGHRACFIERKWVVIFYGILKDQEECVKPPDVKRVIRDLHASGKLGMLYSPEEWMESFKPWKVLGSIPENDAVDKYFRDQVC